MTEPSVPQGGAASISEANVLPKLLAHYIRDLSFENVAAQKGLSGNPQQEVSMNVNLDSRRRSSENRYEVITKLRVTSRSKTSGENLFLLEVQHAGVFELAGEFSEERLRYLLLVECPRMSFPFLRRLVADVTQDGGFPPLILDTIDFLSLYRKDSASRAEAGAEASRPQRLDS